MRSLVIAAVLALTFLTIPTPAILAQNQQSDGKPAVKPRTTIISKSDCSTTGIITFCRGLNGQAVELKIEDMNSPGHMTAIKAQSIQVDYSTGEIKAEGNVTMTLEVLKPK